MIQMFAQGSRSTRSSFSALPRQTHKTLVTPNEPIGLVTFLPATADFLIPCDFVRCSLTVRIDVIFRCPIAGK
jgi:hypothetical protein